MFLIILILIFYIPLILMAFNIIETKFSNITSQNEYYNGVYISLHKEKKKKK